jgi:peroxiredoxin
MGLDTFRSRLWSRFGKGMTLLLALTMMGGLARSFFGGSSSPRLEKGTELPKASIVGIKNATGPIRLDTLKGRPVLLNFWATWCQYCVAELPMIESLYKKFGPRGLAVVALSDESPELIRRWLGRQGAPELTFPIAYDASGRLARQLKVKNIPFTVFLDKEGRVASDVTGTLNEADAEAMVEKLLN